MRLREALAIGHKEVVALVGAGGKTTLLYRLASGLAAAGWRVVVTTTTRLREPAAGQVPALLLAADADDLLRRLPDLLSTHGWVLVAAGATRRLPSTGGHKLVGLPPDWVGRLAAQPEVDAVLVEADGARGRSVKAPAAYEPVIPASTTLLIPVLGADAVGRPLTSAIAHRPRRVAALLGVKLRAPLTPDLLGALLVHPQGGLKGLAPHLLPRPLPTGEEMGGWGVEVGASLPCWRGRAGVGVIPFVNKVEGAARLAAARQIAAVALVSPIVERVVLGAAQATEPVVEVVTKTPRPYVSAVVLAAGGGRRLGRLKQLLPWGGQTMIEHVVDTVLASTVDEVVVVLGCQAAAVQQVLTGRPVRVVVNAAWEEGLASSLRAGLAALSPQAEAVLFVLGDQPRLTAQTIDRLLAHYRTTRCPIVVPVHRGRRGNPVLFARSLFPELLVLQGDVGGRVLLDKQRADIAEVDVGSEEILVDVDTLEDYEAQGREY
ncbi:MAG: molybdenum cofactor cytidylyltransferase [Chloroflexi bacterium]|nr:molybdenum cofactor cytidylyltransferase [Chloroflexota bacterium]